MNGKPIAAVDSRTNEIRKLTARIVNRDILPNERALWRGWRDGDRLSRGAPCSRSARPDRVVSLANGSRAHPRERSEA